MANRPRQKTSYTIGEIIAMISPIVKIDADNLEDVIIITRSACDNCQGAARMTMVSTNTSDDETVFMIMKAIDGMANGS